MKSGFIVQSEEDSIYSVHKEYTGIAAKKSWPLEDGDIRKELEKQWTVDYLDSYNNGNGATLEAIDDEKTLLRYLETCAKKKMNIRVLFVAIAEIEEKNPIFIDSYKTGAYKNPIEMGYDLIEPTGSDFYYSALNDERGILEEAGFISELNQFGIFSDLKLLEKYIEWRNKNLGLGEVEPIGDFVKARIVLVRDFEGKNGV